MFTGIVENLGIVKSMDDKTLDIDFVIEAKNDLKIGDSIAVNGVCLTAREVSKDKFMVSAANETLKLTNLSNLKLDDLVNLESSLTASTPMGGHVVQGHVATTSRIIEKREIGESIYFRFFKPSELENYIVKKGYIAIDGMSLTICDEGQDWFEVMLIPHTLSITIAQNYKINNEVNLEVDVFARYLEKIYGNR
jgi:riboflavin synthase